MNMNNKFDFLFSHKARNHKIKKGTEHEENTQRPLFFLYAATYTKFSHKAITGRLRIRKATSESISEYINTPWDLFYKHASFDELLRSINPSEAVSLDKRAGYEKLSKDYEDLAQVKEEADYLLNHWSPMELAVFRGDDAKLKELKEEARLKELKEEYIKKTTPRNRTCIALNIIRDEPSALLDKKYAIELIELLETIRWNPNRKERERAKFIIDEQLISKHQGAPALLPGNIGAIRAIFFDLAKHLSSECEKYFKDNGLEIKKRGKNKDMLDQENFNQIKEWAERNEDFRFSHIPFSDFKALYYKPATYTNTQIAKYFNISTETLTVALRKTHTVN